MSKRGSFSATLAWTGLALMMLGLLAVVGAGPAYRTGVLPLGVAFDGLRYGTHAALTATALGLAGLIGVLRHGRVAATAAAVVAVAGGLATSALPILHWQQAQDAPPIHDITTDTNDPPPFEALASAREQAPNAVDYPGEETARQQREAYPEIEPLIRSEEPAVVMEAVETVALARGWHVAYVGDTRLEATATTTWFGFEDDVVVRLQEENGGTRVDVRSASRLGVGDAGANAARISAYLDSLERELEGP